MTTTETRAPKKRGGAKPGAGRPKGSPNKKTAALQAEVAASGQTPLEYMLTVMRNTRAPAKRRDAMAAAAAPYVHAKLASIEYTGKDGGPIMVTAITRRIIKA